MHLITCLASVALIQIQGLDVNVQKAKDLLEKIAVSTSQRPGWDEPMTVIEGGRGELSRHIPEFVELEQVANLEWPRILENIQIVAPSRMSETILVISFQSLPADEYLKFLDKAVTLAERKEFDLNLLRWSLFATDKNVRGVLAYNYEDPMVRNIVTRARVLYVDNPVMVKNFDAILSGESQKQSEVYLKDNLTEHRSVPQQLVNMNDPIEGASKERGVDNSGLEKNRFESFLWSYRNIVILGAVLAAGMIVLISLRRKTKL